MFKIDRDVGFDEVNAEQDEAEGCPLEYRFLEMRAALKALEIMHVEEARDVNLKSTEMLALMCMSTLDPEVIGRVTRNSMEILKRRQTELDERLADLRMEYAGFTDIVFVD